MLDAFTLDQARIFLAVAETGSFSAAARRLRRAQSAISQSVISLEKTLEVSLFDRSGARPVMTKAAEALLSVARDLVRRAEALRAKARSYAGGIEPELRIAVDPLFPTAILIEALRKIESDYASTDIRLFAGGLGRPERLLRDRTVSLAIYALETTASLDLESEILMTIEMTPIVSASHPLGRRRARVGHRELAEVVQLVLDDETDHPTWSRGILSDRVWRFHDLKARLEFLVAGFGWCNLPMHLVEDHLASGRLAQLDVERGISYDLSLSAVHVPSEPIGACKEAFLTELRRLIRGDSVAPK